MSKETYTSVKRDLHWCQKRPTLVSKETYTVILPLTSFSRKKCCCFARSSPFVFVCVCVCVWHSCRYPCCLHPSCLHHCCQGTPVTRPLLSPPRRLSLLSLLSLSLPPLLLSLTHHPFPTPPHPHPPRSLSFSGTGVDRCNPRGRTHHLCFFFFPPGTGVDYRALRASGEFAEYVALSGQLSRVDALAMTRYAAYIGWGGGRGKGGP